MIDKVVRAHTGWLALLVVAMASPVHAVGNCGTHAQVIAATEHYGERVTESHFAYLGEDYLGWFEFTKNKKTNTFTWLVTVNGKTCILATNGPRGPEL